jgi:hypothetical protein
MERKEAIETFAQAAFLTRKVARMIYNGNLEATSYESYVEKINDVLTASEKAAILNDGEWCGSMLFLTSLGFILDAQYETVNRRQVGVVDVILKINADEAWINWRNTNVMLATFRLTKGRQELEDVESYARLIGAC